MTPVTSQQKQARLLMRRLTSEIEKWVTDAGDPLFGLNVMIERDDRGEFITAHIRCGKKNVRKIKTPTA